MGFGDRPVTHASVVTELTVASGETAVIAVTEHDVDCLVACSDGVVSVVDVVCRVDTVLREFVDVEVVKETTVVDDEDGA